MRCPSNHKWWLMIRFFYKTVFIIIYITSQVIWLPVNIRLTEIGDCPCCNSFLTRTGELLIIKLVIWFFLGLNRVFLKVTVDGEILEFGIIVSSLGLPIKSTSGLAHSADLKSSTLLLVGPGSLLGDRPLMFMVLMICSAWPINSLYLMSASLSRFSIRIVTSLCRHTEFERFLKNSSWILCWLDFRLDLRTDSGVAPALFEPSWCKLECLLNKD